MLNRKYFLRVNSITIGAVLVLIVVGSIVRSMGAGMGCPDWPKCFGSYIPPTSNEELPENYLDIFRDQRLRKNARLARTFAGLGYNQLANKITNDPLVLQEQEFNVTKAWIEYVNRLVGVVIGLLVFANMIFSFSSWKTNKKLVFAGVIIFVLTGFQGWVGSLVVSTNLLHGFITFHMLLALLILALLIWMNVRIKQVTVYASKTLFWTCFASLVLFVPQILLGTNVRGVVDDLIMNETVRTQWVSYLEVGTFYLHRSYSWLILATSIAIFFLVRKSGFTHLKPYSIQLVILVLAGMLIGIGMIQFEFPFWMQPLHLIIATGIFSLLFYLTLRTKITS